MKAKYYIGILALLLISSTGVITAAIEMRNFNRGNETVVINNYHEDYDFHYSSRINRFHRSYSTFSYYSPVFTDTYWYSWQPFTWGMSIYGGAGLGIGFGFNFPVYNYPVYQPRVSYYNGWYDPWYYAGYDPFYYSGWYAPAYVNISFRNNWRHNYYGWNRHDNWYHSQPVHYSYNNYNTYNNYNSYYSDRSDNGDNGNNGYRGSKGSKGYNINSTNRTNITNRASTSSANSTNSTNRASVNSTNRASVNSTNRTNSINSTQGSSRREAAPNNSTARSIENRAGNVNSMKNSPAARNINTEARAYSREAVKNSAPVTNQAVRRAEAPARQERSTPVAMGSANERQRSVSAPARSSAPAASQQKNSSGGEGSRTATRERSAAGNTPSGRR